VPLEVWVCVPAGVTNNRCQNGDGPQASERQQLDRGGGPMRNEFQAVEARADPRSGRGAAGAQREAEG